MPRFSRYALLGFAASSLLAIGSTTVRAQDAETATHMVAAGDLDLSTVEGAGTLRHRITLAARGVCGPSEMLGAPDYDIYAHCVVDAERQAASRADALIAAVRTGNRFALVTSGD